MMERLFAEGSGKLSSKGLGAEWERILARLEGMGLADDEVIRFFGGNPPPRDLAPEIYAALGERFAGRRLAKLAGWAGMEAMRSLPEVIRSDPGAALGLLDRICAFLPGEPSTGAPSGWEMELATTAADLLARCSEPASTGIRASLRKRLRRIMAEDSCTADYNLIFVDARAAAWPGPGDPPPESAILDLLLDGAAFPVEPLIEAEAAILWARAGSGLFLHAAGDAQAALTEGLCRQAALAAQVSLPARVPGAPRTGAEDWVTAQEDAPDAIKAKEVAAFRGLPLLCRLMARVFGVTGYLDPQLMGGVVRRILDGAERYARTYSAGEEPYQSMVLLYCLTNGFSNDFISRLLAWYNPPYRLAPAASVLPDFGEEQSAAATRSLKERGYCVVGRLPEEFCRPIVEFASTRECALRGEGQDGRNRARYDAARPLAEKYVLNETELMALPQVQALIADPAILGVTQAYLGAKPMLDIIEMWWSTTFPKSPSSEAAQLFHFDMDRVKWLKWFVYLTEVTPGTGPHCVIAGTHRRNAKPASLLRQGYVRIQDRELEAHYRKEDFIEVLGGVGTLIAVDTRIFHKGKMPVDGHRLILELEYTTSLFGGQYERKARLPSSAVPSLEAASSRHPRLFWKYT